MAVVVSDSSFDHGREQLELLAGLKVTTKAVERQTEAIGADVAQQEQAKVQRAVQLDLPQILGSKVPVLYIEMDGTQVPMVPSELEGRRPNRGAATTHTRGEARDSPSTGDLRRCGALLTTGWASSSGSPDDSAVPVTS
jgi:hypothetical protein